MNTFTDGVSGFSQSLFSSSDKSECKNHLLLNADNNSKVIHIEGHLGQKIFENPEEHISIGDSLEDVFPALTGLLPIDDEFVVLPDIQLNGYYVTLYLLSERVSTWVLVLDTTSASAVRRDRQQLVLDSQLSSMAPFNPDLTLREKVSLGKATQFLECNVFQYSLNAGFKPVGNPGAWMHSIMSQMPNGQWALGTDSVFAPYLPQFKKHWKTGSSNAFSCDWIRLNVEGKLLRVRAKAMTVSQRFLLVVQAHEDRSVN